MSINLINVDCMDYMKTVPDKHFDLAIVDPPYGLGNKITNGGTWASKLKPSDASWDIAPSKEYFDQLFRVSNNQIIWGANHFNVPPHRGFIIWDKKLTDNWTLAMAEYAYTSFDMPSKIFRCSLSEGVQKEGERIHICQKPISLYKWLLKNYAKEGDKILDTHLGSGSIALACHDYKFSLVGCEIDKDYYEAACKRFDNYVKQLNIF